MKSFIRHKKIFYIILSLHSLFLAMPVSHAGDIVLCFKDTGQITLELKQSEECSSCIKSGNDPQEKDTCFCVDIPISKEADEHSALLNAVDIQVKPQICIQPKTDNLLNPSPHDGLFSLVNYYHLKSVAHESLRTTVLLI
jgi:hypothetical protein